MLDKINRTLLTISIGIFLFGSGFKIGELQGRGGKISPTLNYQKLNSSTNSRQLDFSLYWEVWDKLEKRFVHKERLDQQKMFYESVRGMVSSADDPYTFFLTPDENKQSKDDLGGVFQGIGAELGLKNNLVTVIAPLKNSPAERAGVRAGDIIYKVDGKSTEKWTLQQAVGKIRGKKGTMVKLTLIRKDKEIEVEIIRDDIKVDSVELKFENNIAVIRLNRFGDTTNDEWDKAVADIVRTDSRKKLTGVILDMRDNPGGYLQGSVYIASEFLPSNKIVVKQEYTDGSSEEYKVKKTGKLLTIPLVVIINKGSASASEIVAGAIRDYKRGRIVGEKSFGKGSIQEALDLSRGAGLHVTIAKWVLPKGDWIDGKGINPEINIVNELKDGETISRATDKQLDKAIDLLIK